MNNNKLTSDELNYLLAVLSLQENKLENELSEGVTPDRAREIVQVLDKIKSIVAKITYSNPEL